ncbi:MAG: Asp-tRNA(Asn)/Glu-tRNA(Gln) amidotransferase subunit GatA [Candidatus Eisenbacteria bacterium]|nr:Asp-tRNA(Asn)/Glu-tRNA(Gln) amidotransferase subunit GatA [Candidatus Eisenbacteria bacterium]
MIPRELSAAEAAGRIRRGELRARELVDGCLERCRRVEPLINAFITVDAGGVRAAAEEVDRRVAAGEDPGPLAGVPVAVKDNICTRDLPTTCGSRMLESFRPGYDATAVGRLRAAGAVIFAKTNLDEFGLGSSTEHSAFGPTRNPWSSEHVPGGSSGGSAAALAAGVVPLALGTDTGGSVRQPAAHCGNVGLKPHYGAVSRYGLVAFASSFDGIGPMARTAADAALLYNVLAGHDRRDSTSLPQNGGIPPESLAAPVQGLSVAVPRAWLEHCDAEVVRVFDDTARALRDLGVTLREVRLPSPRHALAAYAVLSDAEVSSNLARYDGVRYGRRARGADRLDALYVRSRSEGLGQEVKRRILLGTCVLSAGYQDAYYIRAQRARRLFQAEIDAALGDAAALFLPTAPTPPFRLGERRGDPLAMYAGDLYTIPANLTGRPAVSFPAGWTSDGLPVGMQLYGRRDGAATLMQLAAAVGRAVEAPRPAPDPSHDGGAFDRRGAGET